MRLLFSKSASPHHGFAAYYTYLEKIFGVRANHWLAGRIAWLAVCWWLAWLVGAPSISRAPRCRPACPLWPSGTRAHPPPPTPQPPRQADAVLHFGTHGSLEFMPGKQVGMSGVCYPDSLIGTIPNL